MEFPTKFELPDLDGDVAFIDLNDTEALLSGVFNTLSIGITPADPLYGVDTFKVYLTAEQAMLFAEALATASMLLDSGTLADLIENGIEL